jgi:hypothetical protein
VIVSDSHMKAMITKISSIAADELKVSCRVVNVAMDGNCMFSSMALQLGRNSTNAGHDVRDELVQYMTSHREMVGYVSE